jgi:hypothetical protein
MNHNVYTAPLPAIRTLIYPLAQVVGSRQQAAGTNKKGKFCEAASPIECAICLEEVEQGSVLRTLPCLHKFHKVCMCVYVCVLCACV